eukprot:TRINITY_DN20997_c0_g1_i1.p1 TRINITY_DN20997_c0_g1~~TRINITY_DN20997_c0_g1_i1.p1  ORF type:complete len:277 (+),score=134.18 TRINITY_DN20997_c0_g1_i1:71-901(+)
MFARACRLARLRQGALLQGRWCSEGKGVKESYEQQVKEFRDVRAKQEEEKEQSKDREVALQWLQYGLMALSAPLAWWYFKRQVAEKKKQVGYASETRTVGEASIGGPWTMIGTDGKPLTRADFYGVWPIMYFGFTHCPEICPVELNRLANCYERLGKMFPNVKFQPLFVSCDPLRDCLAEIDGYMKEFHKDFVGGIGTPEQVKEICKAHRIYYSEPTDLEGADGDYLVDHSIAIYFFDDKFEFVEAFGPRWQEDEIVEKMAKIMEKHLLLQAQGRR